MVAILLFFGVAFILSLIICPRDSCGALERLPLSADALDSEANFPARIWTTSSKFEDGADEEFDTDDEDLASYGTTLIVTETKLVTVTRTVTATVTTTFTAKPKCNQKSRHRR
jgi:hypothetical protein